jgi:hypothetical protein
MIDDVSEEIEVIMELVEHYGSIRHLGGYKKASFSFTKNKNFEKKYLDLFDYTSKLSEKIECKIKKLVDLT